MSKKFLISEDEKNFIINLYGNKGIILEQGTNVGTVSANQNVDLSVINLSNKRKVLDLCKTETSKKYWLQMYSDESQKQLVASTINAVINAKDPITRVAIKKAIGSTQEPSKPEDSKTPPSEDNVTEIAGFSLTIPPETKTSNWFCNNKSELSKQGLADIDTNIIKPIVDSMNFAKQNAISDLQKAGVKDAEKKIVVKACLDSMSIATSCSRYVNTKDAANKTFMVLATERANSVDNYIRTKLNEIGVKVGCKSTELPKSVIDATGTNKDGSSGPNPPKPNNIPVSGKEGDYNKDESKRNEFGAPLAGKPETNSCNESTNGTYNQFKYVRVSPTIGISPVIVDEPGSNENKPGQETKKPPVPIVNKSTEYVVTLFTESSGGGGSSTKFKWKYKWKFDFGKNPKLPKNLTPKKLDCYSF